MKKVLRRGHRVKLPGGGYVRYHHHLGNDREIAMAARTSTKRQNDSRAEHEGLLRYLFVNRHTSPFEQASLTVDIQMPIFLMRQFVRHRMFRLNEQSARYAPLDADWWRPSADMIRIQNTEGNRQSSHEAGEDTVLLRLRFIDALDDLCDASFRQYNWFLKQGIAREQARVLLPLAALTTIRVNMDVHNLCHFLYLRTHPHAQWEMRELAGAILQIFERLFPDTAALFHKYEPVMRERETARTKWLLVDRDTGEPA